ncbi:MAG: hypothetical protein R6W83_02070 [Cryobacterium sp.]
MADHSAAARSAPRRHARAWAVPVAGLIALTGCSVSSPDAGTDAVGTAPQAISQFEHVHGLGADPLTGHTYAATHQGVWRIPTSAIPDSYLAGAPRSTVTEPEQIAGRAMDAMGFTVAAPGLLLASGHPDPTEHLDLALPNLGLVSSTDAAHTWTALSLQGETDFHSLEAVALNDASLRVYGYDAGSGTVSVSDDSGLTWEQGASLALRDLAADPAHPDEVFATTADGLAVSVDAGRTFALLPAAPPLLLVDTVDAASGGGLVGIDPNGTLWRQEAATETWVQTGTLTGVPEAFSFIGGDSPWIIAANAEGITASQDFGVSWTVLTSLTE